MQNEKKKLKQNIGISVYFAVVNTAQKVNEWKKNWTFITENEIRKDIKVLNIGMSVNIAFVDAAQKKIKLSYWIEK